MLIGAFYKNIGKYGVRAEKFERLLTIAVEVNLNFYDVTKPYGSVERVLLLMPP